MVYVATHHKWRKMAVSSNPFGFLLLLVVALSGIETVGGLGAGTQIPNHTLTHCVSSRSVSAPGQCGGWGIVLSGRTSMKTVISCGRSIPLVIKYSRRMRSGVCFTLCDKVIRCTLTALRDIASTSCMAPKMSEMKKGSK